MTALIDKGATMRSMSLEQLRATISAGGVTGVTLSRAGGGFFAEIATRSGQDAEGSHYGAASLWQSYFRADRLA